MARRSGEETRLETPGGSLPFLPGECHCPDGAAVSLAVRSEQLRFERMAASGAQGDGIQAVVKEKSFAGGMLRITFALAQGEEVVASRHGIDLDLHPEEKVLLSWEPQAATVVEEDGT